MRLLVDSISDRKLALLHLLIGSSEAGGCANRTELRKMAELKHFKHVQDSAPNGDAPPSYYNAAYQPDASINTVEGEVIPTTAHSSAIAIPAPGEEELDKVVQQHEEEEEEEWEDTRCSRAVGVLQGAVYGFLSSNADSLWVYFYFLLLGLYLAYFIAAMIYKFGDEGSLRLLVVTSMVGVYLLYRLVEHLFSRGVLNCCCSSQAAAHTLTTLTRKIRLEVVLLVGVVLFAVIYTALEIAQHKPRNLISVGGMATFILLFYIFSSNPARVKWRPVVWGILLQFIFAVLILRTRWGFQVFEYLGDRITEFLAYTDAGSKFVFGEEYERHFFAFKVLPTVIFFSTCMSMLYYVGFMQFVIRNVGRFLAFCLGTSPAESLNAAGNIFIGQSEAPLMIRPFLADMTMSELHAVLTGGFATIAGSVLAAYILYGVPANHLLSASVMSAPAALAMSKLFYPETERVKHTGAQVYNMAKGAERNIIEAASNGASQSIKLVANIAVNLIAFVALLDCLNATLVWLGHRVGMYQPELTFQLVCSYVFYPLSLVMGVEEGDRLQMGKLVGTKTFLNEFYAYTELSTYITNRATLNQYVENFTLGLPSHPTGSWFFNDSGLVLVDTDTILEAGLLSERTVVIATYALCGFSNLGSMGVMLGALGAMAPSRKSDISTLVVRAMIAGNVACFMTACIAGLLST